MRWHRQRLDDSPFGQQRCVPSIIDRHALGQKYIHVNAGQRGLQLLLSPADILRAIDAVIADITQAR